MTPTCLRHLSAEPGKGHLGGGFIVSAVSADGEKPARTLRTCLRGVCGCLTGRNESFEGCLRDCLEK